jgi:hypothetical protein
MELKQMTRLQPAPATNYDFDKVDRYVGITSTPPIDFAIQKQLSNETKIRLISLSHTVLVVINEPQDVEEPTLPSIIIIIAECRVR